MQVHKSLFLLLLISLLIISCKEQNIIENNNGIRTNASLKKVTTVPPNNTILTVLYSYQVGNDRIPVENPYEIGNNNSFGQIAYITKDWDATSYTLNRLVHSPGLGGDFWDNMISKATAESTRYSLVRQLGCLWANNSFWQNGRNVREGTTEIHRFKNSNGDHDFGFTLPYGYSDDGFFGYAFNRYGNLNEDLITLSNGTVTLKANKVAGGAIWELSWDGTQFINHFDFGREIQIAFNINGNENDNPTEAGDEFSTTIYTNQWHGSPLIYYSTNGTSYLSTSTRPLQFFPSRLLSGTGVDPELHPILWNGEINKTIEMNALGNAQIIKWQTEILFPTTVTSSEVEVVTAYLTGDFTRFYVYKSATDELIPKTLPVVNPNVKVGLEPQGDTDLNLSNGGVIIQHGTEDKALGVFYKTSAILVSRDGFTFHNYSESSTSKTADSEATTKWALRRILNSVNNSYYSQTVYLVVGTLAQCKSMMQSLALSGVTNNN